MVFAMTVFARATIKIPESKFGAVALYLQAEATELGWDCQRRIRPSRPVPCIPMLLVLDRGHLGRFGCVYRRQGPAESKAGETPARRGHQQLRDAPRPVPVPGPARILAVLQPNP